MVGEALLQYSHILENNSTRSRVLSPMSGIPVWESNIRRRPYIIDFEGEQGVKELQRTGGREIPPKLHTRLHMYWDSRQSSDAIGNRARSTCGLGGSLGEVEVECRLIEGERTLMEDARGNIHQCEPPGVCHFST